MARNRNRNRSNNLGNVNQGRNQGNLDQQMFGRGGNPRGIDQTYGGQQYGQNYGGQNLGGQFLGGQGVGYLPQHMMGGGFGQGGGGLGVQGQGRRRRGRGGNVDRDIDRDLLGTSGNRSSVDYRGRGPKGFTRSDDRIREDISQLLFDHPRIDASEIDIRVRGGEVTLEGHVPSQDMKWLTIRLIDRVGGVQQVFDQIRVRRDVQQTTTSNDQRQGTGFNTRDQHRPNAS